MRTSQSDSMFSGQNLIYALIAVNALAFLLIPMGSRVWLYDLALSVYGMQSFKLWQLVTYMFLHGSFSHIFFNMWGLYLFGMVILPILGTARFLQLYFLSGMSGAGLWLLLNWHSNYPLIGASGAIFGVMMAAAMLHPNMRIQLLFPPIPMTMKTFVTVYAVIEIVSEISSGGRSSIAHLAHLGGFFSAYLYLKFLYGDRVWDMFAVLGSWRKRRPAPFQQQPPLRPTSKLPDGWQVYSRQHSESQTVSNEEINRILDKISATGIGSLTQDELDALNRASGEMRH